MVPGTGLAPDKMLLARGFAYSDAHRARLGVNDKQVPVNRPKSPVHNYQKDGVMQIINASDPVHAPNSHGGPKADPTLVRGDNTWVYGINDEMARRAYSLREDDDDWGQASTLVREVFDEAARDRLVSNVAGHLSNGVSDNVLQRAFEYWRNVDKEIGDRIAQAVTDH